MKDLKVTIIIPVYNVEYYIERCARSYYEQTYPDIEYIWVNDATPDNSIAKLRHLTEKYPERKEQVRIINFINNQGPSVARYTALAEATGDYVFFSDSDDWVEPAMIEKLVKHAQNNHSDIVWCDYFCTYGETNILYRQDFIPTVDSCIRALLTEKMHGAYWNKLFKRSLFTDNKISYSPEANVCEDLFACIQLMYFSRQISYCSEAFYHYVQDNPHSLSSTFSPKKLSEVLINIDNILDFLHIMNVSDQYAREMIYLKLLGKKTLLTTTDLKYYKQWHDIYPDSNSSYKMLPRSLRLPAFLAAKSCWIPLTLWLKLKILSNKMRKK